jgi:chromosome segregation protein
MRAGWLICGLFAAALAYTAYRAQGLQTLVAHQSGKIHELEDKLKSLQDRMGGEKKHEEEEVARLRGELKTRQDALADVDLRLNRGKNQGEVREELPLLQSKLADATGALKDLQRQLRELRTQEKDSKNRSKLSVDQKRTLQKLDDGQLVALIHQYQSDPRQRAYVQALKDQRTILAQRNGLAVNQAETDSQKQDAQLNAAAATLETNVAQQRDAVADLQAQVAEDKGERSSRKQEMDRLAASSQELHSQIRAIEDEIAARVKKIEELSQ